jgi:hypothetical protein
MTYPASPYALDRAPIPVHVTGTSASPRRRVKAVYRTFVLSAAAPVIPIAAEDLSRRNGWAIAYGSSVVLCESQSQAQDPGNAVASAVTGFTLTPANPQGTLLYVPQTGTLQSDRWPIDSNDVIWASALLLTGTEVAYLAVTLYSRADGY